MTQDLLSAYALAFAQITPAGTPSDKGADALIELLAGLIAAQGSEGACAQVMEICAAKLGQRVAQKLIQKRGMH